MVQLFGGIEDGHQFGDGAVYTADIFGGQVCEGAERRAHRFAYLLDGTRLRSSSKDAERFSKRK